MLQGGDGIGIFGVGHADDAVTAAIVPRRQPDASSRFPVVRSGILQPTATPFAEPASFLDGADRINDSFYGSIPNTFARDVQPLTWPWLFEIWTRSFSVAVTRCR